jgi:hypothetical protein
LLKIFGDITMIEKNVIANRINQIPFVNEDRTKEIVIETLIELGLVPKPERKKGLSDV